MENAPEMAPLEAAYIAGIIDGEGSIGLPMRTGREGAEHQRSAQVSISNTHLETLQWIAGLVGVGKILQQNRQGAVRACYAYSVTANGCRHLLPQVLPYLRIKKRQAEAVLEYLALIRGKQGIAAADVPRALALGEEVSRLNSRGLGEGAVLYYCTHDGCRHKQYEGGPYCYRHWLKLGEKKKGVCEHCGTEMEMTHPSKRFCSQKCFASDYHLTVVKPGRDAVGEARERLACPVCGLPVDRSKYKRKTYCSEGCYRKANQDHLNAYKREKRRLARPQPQPAAAVAP